jgi:hypothetical protein
MNDVVVTDKFKNEMSLTGGDIDRVVKHLEQVKEAVRKVLKEGIDGDFAVIPGTKKKSLLKPGAEKLMRLFGLGVRFVPVENVFDLVENFAMYSYNAEVFHLKTGLTIAATEGTANSQEKKYKEKAVYINNVKSGTEPILVADIINTLKKMAQKRAMVGAVIIAVGASDYFTQDEDEIAGQQANHKTPEKTSADRFGEGGKDHSSYMITFGKHDGKTLGGMDPKILSNYLDYMTKMHKNPDGKLKEFIDTAREFLR